MKVVFLDIDGVLNGQAYQKIATESPPIDQTRLPILKEILDKSGAKVVLTSSWRTGWEPGCSFDATLREGGILIHDVTPRVSLRPFEIAAWLKEHPEVESFVILDDTPPSPGWGTLISHMITTDPIHTPGLEQTHIPLALEILNKT